MKFDTENIIEAMRESQLNPDDIDAVCRKLDEIAQEIEEEKLKNRQPRIKKELVLLNPKDTLIYYVAQIKEGEDITLIPSKIQKAIGDYNESAKKKKVEIHNLSEAIEYIPNKILKDNEVIMKTKTPCSIVGYDN